MAKILEDLSELHNFLIQLGNIPPHDGFLMLNLSKKYEVGGDGRLCVSEADFVSPNNLAVQYDQITNSGFAWINLSCYGLYKKKLLVVVETPSRKGHSSHTSINFSGPSRWAITNGWSIEPVLAFH